MEVKKAVKKPNNSQTTRTATMYINLRALEKRGVTVDHTPNGILLSLEGQLNQKAMDCFRGLVEELNLDDRDSDNLIAHIDRVQILGILRTL